MFRSTELAGLPIQIWKAPCRGPRPPGVLIATAKPSGLKVLMDPPWENPTHKAFKEVLKGLLGARWDKGSRAWIVGPSALLQDFWMFTAEPNITLTEGAWKQLQQTQKRQQLSGARDASSDQVRQKIDAVLPKGRQLYPFQYAAVEFLVRANGRALLAEQMGCVDGEAKITINRGGKGGQVRLKDLYRRFHRLRPHSGPQWRADIDTFIRGAHGNQLRRTRVLDVLDKGERPVVNLVLASGKTLRLTPDHKVCVRVDTNGTHHYAEAQHLRVGEQVVVNGQPVCKTCGEPGDIITSPHAKFKGHCRTCIYRRLRSDSRSNAGGITFHKGYRHIARGLRYHPHRNKTMGMPEHRLVYEADMNNLLLDEWLDVCHRNAFTADHVFLDPVLEVHHKNGVITDNRIENLEALRKGEHRSRHPTYSNFGFTVITTDTVMEVSAAGTAHVYDVVCEAPHHNFVANGIVVHNCGKTVEAIGYLAYRPDQRPGVLVVPAVVAGNWVNELAVWLPDEPVQWLQTGKMPLDPEASLWVVSYDLLKKRLPALLQQKPRLLVADECQMIRNSKAARSKAFIKLARHKTIEAFIGLSGTPVVNRPLEFYTFLNLLRPDEFSNWFHYTKQYCDGHHEEIYIKGGHGEKKKVWVANGVSNTDELHRRLKGFMIRRLKQDVLTELPAKTYQLVPVQMKPAERSLYRNSIPPKEEGALVQITAARQAAGEIKVRAAAEWIQQYHETDTPVLVFCHHRVVLDGLQAAAEKLDIRWGRIDGSTAAKRRTQLVERFQQGELDCMLLSAQAAGVGITLTAASDVLMVERQWTTAAEEQAFDRAHRIGQTNAVTVRILVLRGTIDDDMAELLQGKQKMLDAVLDGKLMDNEQMDLDIRDELVARWEGR